MQHRLRTCKLLAVLPVGPDNNGADTIDSIFRYCTPSVVIIAIDDSDNPETKKFLETVDKRVVRLPSGNFKRPASKKFQLPSAKYKHLRGALFCNIAMAYRYAVDNYNFDILLRIDTDALVIGPRPEDEALKIIEEDPQVGMLGLYRYMDSGEARNFSIVREAIIREAAFLGIFKYQRWQRLQYWLRTAKLHGYQWGEHCLGAAVYQNPKTIRRFARAGDLNVTEFSESVLSEDHLFSLLTIRHGYTLADFATGPLPMGVRWRGLPDSPQNLLSRGKKIVHSIKSYADMSEADIRTYFAAARHTRPQRSRAKKNRRA
jgi:hypothetical protein